MGSIIIPIVIVVGGWLFSSFVAGGMKVKGRDKSAEDMADLGLRANVRSTEEPIKVIYGKARVGGNDVFMGNTGADNKFLWIVQTLAESECDSIEAAYFGDKNFTEYSSYAWKYFHSGSNSQTVDSNLNSAKPSWTFPLRNTCYVVWKLKYNMNVYRGIPDRTVILKGRKLYDIRTSTTAWSQNPVLALYDFLTNNLYGAGYDSTKIDTTSWGTAADYCDTKNFKLNYAISKLDSQKTVIDSILMTFRGGLKWYNGKLYLHYRDTTQESSIFTIKDEHIIQDNKGKAQVSITQPKTFDKPDAVKVKFVDPTRNYLSDVMTIGEKQGNVKELILTNCGSKQHAADIGAYLLEREILDRTVSGIFRGDLIKVEPLDLVTFNSSALAISNQLLRVVDQRIDMSGNISLLMEYESDSLYNDDYDIDVDSIYNVDLVGPDDPVPGVTNVNMAESNYNYDLKTFTQLEVTFDIPASYPWFDHVDVYLSHDNVTWTFLYPVTDDFTLYNVKSNTNYWVLLRTVNIWGKYTESEDIKSFKNILGISQQYPPDLASLQAVIQGNNVNLYGVKLTNPDIEVYEFRLGSSWAGAVFLASLRSPNLSLKGVKPGSHTFFCSTLGCNGLYGQNPPQVSVNLIDPPDGYDVVDIRHCIYEGSFSNEQLDEYTEVDPNSRITINSASKATFTGLTKNEDAYLYKDFTAGYFDGDFDFFFEILVSSTVTDCGCGIVALTNLINDLYGIDFTDSGDFLAAIITGINTSTYDIRARECDGGSSYDSSVITLNQNTLYYGRLWRDESVGTYGTLYIAMYSDADRTTQVGSTQSVTLHTSKKDFRYLFALNSYNSGSALAISGYVQNIQKVIGAGTHDNTEHTTYNSTHYLKCLNGNKVINGDMEDNAHWANYNSPTVNERSTTQKKEGTYSRKFTVDAQYDGIQNDDYTSETSKTYVVSFWIYPDDTTNGAFAIRKGDDSGWLYTSELTSLTQDSWNSVTVEVTETAGGAGAYICFYSPTGQSTGTWYIDKVRIIEKLPFNRILNGCCELTTNWTDYGTPSVNERSTGQVYDGTYSWKVTIDAEYEGAANTSLTTENGKSYTLTFYVYPDDWTSIGVRIRNGNDTGYLVDTEISNLTQDAWNLITITFTEGASTGGSSAWLAIKGPAGQSSGTFYFDNVYIKKSGDNHLFGRFESGIYDLGSASRYLAYILADLTVVGAGTIWDSKLPDPTTWNSVQASSKTWNQIFELSEGPTVEMSLMYGSSSPPASELERMEILSGEIQNTQYLKIRIDITNPSQEVHAMIEHCYLKLLTSI